MQRHRGRLVDPQKLIEAPRPGYLVCQDTYFVGTIKGVGKIYHQTVVDAHSSLAFGKLYLSKMPMTAVDLLHDRLATDERLLRAIPPDAQGGILRCGLPEDPVPERRPAAGGSRSLPGVLQPRAGAPVAPPSLSM
jgi:hypothetical protein